MKCHISKPRHNKDIKQQKGGLHKEQSYPESYRNEQNEKHKNEINMKQMFNYNSSKAGAAKQLVGHLMGSS